MEKLSDNQLIHRAYLASPVWKSKRGEALAFYGCKCNRCGEWGNDVHHKTYERTGGQELMEDLEVLCRECHEAHHEAERCGVKTKGIRMIHRRAIYERLTLKHAQILHEEFPNHSRDLFMLINYGATEVADRAARLLGFDYAYGKQPRKKRSRVMDMRGDLSKNCVTQDLSSEELGNNIIERKNKRLAEVEFIVQFLFILLKFRQRQ